MANILHDEYELDLACAKAIAIEYLSINGVESVSTKADLSVSIQKTFNHPIDQVYKRAVDWFESEDRAELQDHINRKRLNCKWLSDNSQIGVKFEKKGSKKTQMIVEHGKLDNAGDAEVMRNFWKERIPKMIESL